MIKPLQQLFTRAGKLSKGISDDAWGPMFEANRAFAWLDESDEMRLRRLTEICLRKIPIVAGKGMEVDAEVRLTLAAQMCLPILNLGIEHYAEIKEVIVYEDLFLSYVQTTDQAGVVHHRRRVLSGESWQRGPVILSWAHARADRPAMSYPSNVVIHEFAHKLDQLNGSMNGMPPLHKEMHRPAWTNAMDDAYKRLRAPFPDEQAQQFDPYAASKPAEFFAVCSEYFFEAPDKLFAFSPEVYVQLKMYYRQDPLNRMLKVYDEALIADEDGSSHLLA